MASIAAGGRRIFFDQQGEGPALIMFSGRIVSRRGWAFQLPDFARTYRVIAPDNRDAGESDPEPGPYSVTDMANDAVALLDALGVARAHVLGHSMGTAIAARLAVDHPGRVERLILASGGVLPRRQEGAPPPFVREEWIDDPAARRRLRAVFSAAPGFFEEHPELHAATVEHERGNRLTYEGVLRQMGAMADAVREDGLATIAAPTLVLHGDQDGLIPVERGEALARAIPGARLLILPGVGHSPHIERTAEFNRAVLAFLRGEEVGAESR